MNLLDFSFSQKDLIYKNLKGANSRSHIYFTFDDGPVDIYSEKLLDRLNALNLKVTFYVVGIKAQRHKDIIQRFISEGHSIGDHSWGHEFSYYFSSRSKIHQWISYSWEKLSDLLGQRPKGFRSPAGVVTPPLLKALGQLRIPLVLWNRRFFDTQFDIAKVNKTASELFQAGDIVLLHENGYPHRFESLNVFLSKYAGEIKKLGFECAAIQDYQLSQVR